MTYSVKQFADLTGVSVRTLHYYDQIGLLKQNFVDAQNGYRFYGEQALGRMQEILFYRELDFSLKVIQEILSSPHYNKQTALKEQKQLLVLKKERLERIIEALEVAEKGVTPMNFEAFNEQEINAYKEEAQRRWGDTAAWREYEQKTAENSEQNQKSVGDRLNAIFADFATLLQEGVGKSDLRALDVTKRLQDCITETQYTCTDEILLSLGALYVSDERFTANIDRHGKGTAAFANKAIQAYCINKT